MTWTDEKLIQQLCVILDRPPRTPEEERMRETAVQLMKRIQKNHPEIVGIPGVRVIGTMEAAQ